MSQEMKKYLEVRRYKDYVKHMIYPELIDWVESMERLYRSNNKE
jgi:hypothetical protein